MSNAANEAVRMNMESTPATAVRRQILIFRIAEEWYALDVARVRRVEATPEITLVPSAPRALPGVFVSQGQLIPAVEPRAVLDLPGDPPDAPAFVVIAGHEESVGGILVDWVDEVLRVGADAVEAPTPRSGGAFATGQLRLGERLVSILDLEALFRSAAGEA